MKIDVVVVDDEEPQLDELCFLLRRDERIGSITPTRSATDTLRILRESEVDVVFLDIQMPGLSGLDLAGVLANFKNPPLIVFVTAHEAHAVQAFELEAVDYVLKPVREERLTRAIGRVIEQRGSAVASRADDQIAVELGGSPVSSPAATSATWRPKATTPDCTPLRVATCCAPR